MIGITLMNGRMEKENILTEMFLLFVLMFLESLWINTLL